MRTKRQMEIRKDKVTQANFLLEWLIDKNLNLGDNVAGDIIDPYAKQSKMDHLLVWRAWDYLKETGRCKSFSCWQWAVVSRKPIKMLQDGSLR